MRSKSGTNQRYALARKTRQRNRASHLQRFCFHSSDGTQHHPYLRQSVRFQTWQTVTDISILCLFRTSRSGVPLSVLSSPRKFGNKLSTKSTGICLLALFLAAIFFAAQLHCCVDLNSSTMDSHACPVCHSVGAAIGACAAIIAMALAIHRLEILFSLPPLFLLNFRNITPRAPPVPC